VIDYDQPCAGCNYSLRGLRLGERCPECGKVIPEFSISEERHLLHRADRQYLQSVVLGCTLLMCVVVGGTGALVLAVVGDASRQVVLAGSCVACVAWAAAWQPAAAGDRLQAAESPFNTGARHTRLMAALACIMLAAHALAALLGIGFPTGASWAGDFIGLAAVLTYMSTGAAVLAHLATASSYCDSVLHRPTFHAYPEGPDRVDPVSGGASAARRDPGGGAVRSVETPTDRHPRAAGEPCHVTQRPSFSDLCTHKTGSPIRSIVTVKGPPPWHPSASIL